MIIILFIMVMFSNAFLSAEGDAKTNDLKIIEQFLSSMTTLEANMQMTIAADDQESASFEGKIWLDRRKQLLRINYGKNAMIAKNGTLFIYQENQDVQKFDATDTPAGLLLKPVINFKNEQIVVTDFIKEAERWKLSLTYDSPAGQIPVLLYFKPPPVIILLGWEIQNPNGSITRVELDSKNTHMAVPIDEMTFSIG